MGMPCNAVFLPNDARSGCFAEHSSMIDRRSEEGDTTPLDMEGRSVEYRGSLSQSYYSQPPIVILEAILQAVY